ncbi:tetratricopeptide repeat protein [Neptunomonas sp.]|uniref:tetratricopeptide repeat protein n=1 Tax=Neptunomonas sp. TaxID=1971898 RepID=UPI0025F8EDA6|nr:tetratricopeptide repeat protein [Neptunomonas sp.]
MESKFKLANQYFNKNQITLARPLFAEVLENSDKNFEALYKLGVCDFRLEKFKEAGDSFSALIEVEPRNSLAWYYLGLTKERRGDKDKAIEKYHMALLIDPDLEVAQKKLSELGIEPTVADQPKQTVFQTQDEDGPGLLLYSSKYRRPTSFSIHIIMLLIGSVLFLILFLDLDKRLIHTYFGRFRDIIGFAAIIFFLPTFVDIILRSVTTKYDIYERRIDIRKGILFRTHTSIWLFEIINIELSENPVELLTRNSRIALQTQDKSYPLLGLVKPKREGKSKLRTINFNLALFDELRSAVREQRGAVKKVWI